MTSLYKQSVPVFIKYLDNFSALLVKGAKYAEENQKSEDDVLKYRLVEDMQGLTHQVLSCCNTAVWFADRVGRLEHVVVEDTETTFQQLQDRIAKTIDYLKQVDPKAIDNNVDKPLLMETKMGKFQFESGQTYFSDFALANFHFHLASGYCLLREQRVPIGALDYLRNVFKKVD